MSETITGSWAHALREAAQNLHDAPVERVATLRQQFQALKEDLPRGALKAQEKAADEIERQVRRSELKSLGDEVCAVLAEFGLRMRVEGVAQRRKRKSAKPAATTARPASVPDQPFSPKEPRGGEFLRRSGDGA